MKTANSIITVLFVLLAAQIASAYYCPSTGRWLSRDPMGEPGFETLRAARVVPQAEVASPTSLPAGRWINRDPIGGAEFEVNQNFTLTKDDLQYLASLDPGDENLDVLENALRNILYTSSKTAYVPVNNDLVNKTDFYGLVCNIVANRTKYMASGFINEGHEWIVYDSKSVGFWPNKGYKVLRPDPGQTTPFPIYWQWDTVQKKSGTIKWGPAAGKSCACATCADILPSLDAAPNPGWHSFPIRNNCRRFVKWAFDGSCLEKGKKTLFNP